MQSGSWGWVVQVEVVVFQVCFFFYCFGVGESCGDLEGEWSGFVQYFDVGCDEFDFVGGQVWVCVVFGVL